MALADFVERAYLDYSMYVVLDRALPSLHDGLKPVQRRILYAMTELGLHAAAKPKKSARTIGDVIGKYHPHGDTACYEAMVLMGQPFACRYPLIEGQGNWGSNDDPKSFAAMRYTEARLSRYASVLLDEIRQGTVQWRRNFDSTMDEPEVLPAQLPNLLLNGASGIAVGMSTDVPPHNLTEVCKACIHLLDKTSTSLQELMQIVPGPDFPGGGEIINSPEELAAIYETGSGLMRVRATYVMHEKDIVINALPYQVSVVRVMQQIVSLVRDKKFHFIQELRDESDQDYPVRLVISLKGANPGHEKVMSHLFFHTDLERTCRVSLNVIGIDGKPQVKPLRQLLLEWLDLRKHTVRNRLQWRLTQIQRRLEELEGLRIAYLNLDQIINIIRTGDDIKTELMQCLRLSELQAGTVLELRLRRLAKLEQLKIEQEYHRLSIESKEVASCLASARRLKSLIKGELKKAMREYGDSRKTGIIPKPPAQTLNTAVLLTHEKVTVVLSRMGWVRVAKGHDVEPTELIYRSGDEFLSAVRGNINQSIVLLDTTGRCYTLPLHQLPSARGHGEPLSRHLNFPENSAVIGAVIAEPPRSVILANNAGYGFRTSTDNLKNRGRNGKQVLRLDAGLQAVVLSSVPSDGEVWIAVINRSGHLLVVNIREIPVMLKGKGNKIIHIHKNELLAGTEGLLALACIDSQDVIRIHAGKRSKRMTFAQLEEYIGKRGQRGLKLPKLFRNVRRLETLQP